MKKGNVFIIIGLVLIIAALCLAGYNVWDSNRAEKAAIGILEQLRPVIREPVPVSPVIPSLDDPEETVFPAEIEYPDYILNPEMDLPVTTIDGIGYVGVLDIPALGLTFPVCGEWTMPNLKLAPCRYAGTPYLGNMVICGHNYRQHFGPIDRLSYGDIVIFTDMDGNEFVYEVSEVETVRGTDIEGMLTGDWDLSLFTCTLDGGSRITVRCIEKKK